MRLWLEAFYTTETIFVVKNSFQSSVSPPQVPSPEETEDVGSTTIGEYPK
jgi:hypothetical protein